MNKPDAIQDNDACKFNFNGYDKGFIISHNFIKKKEKIVSKIKILYLINTDGNSIKAYAIHEDRKSLEGVGILQAITCEDDEILLKDVHVKEVFQGHNLKNEENKQEKKVGLIGTNMIKLAIVCLGLSRINCSTSAKDEFYLQPLGERLIASCIRKGIILDEMCHFPDYSTHSSAVIDALSKKRMIHDIKSDVASFEKATYVHQVAFETYSTRDFDGNQVDTPIIPPSKCSSSPDFLFMPRYDRVVYQDNNTLTTFNKARFSLDSFNESDDEENQNFRSFTL